MSVNSYREAGVDIDRGDQFASFIGGLASPAVSSGLGGFAGGVELDWGKYRRPVLLSSTDGVGTKLLAAQGLNRFDTVGIDLVAMCVNDLAVCGADPQVFLDYIACGKLDEGILREVIQGVVRGCEMADCILAGGETAEMPDMYQGTDFDLAGFSVGLVEKEQQMPFSQAMKPGDKLFGLPSSGIHSNGLSLARKVLPSNDREGWSQLLEPTVIYVRALRQLRRIPGLLGAAHITGGGLEANTRRLLPEGLKPRFTWQWPVPEIFPRIQKAGSIEAGEMRRVFNMGIGLALTVEAEKADQWQKQAREKGLNPLELGELAGDSEESLG